MILRFLFPEGPRVRRLASTLAMPRAGSKQDLAMATPTYAYFLSLPWDGKPLNRRRRLDLRTMGVGSWFESVPWEGMVAVSGEQYDYTAPPVPAHLQDTDRSQRSADTGIAVSRPTPSTKIDSFFSDFFRD